MESWLDEALRRGPRFRLRPSTILDLHRCAVQGLLPAPGAFRVVSMDITEARHQPPAPREVPGLVEDLCDHVHDTWSTATPIHLAAYTMWRLNWIHPFVDGNGRTSRALSYLTLCARLGHRLPGSPTVPERVAESKAPYYAALESADLAWSEGRLDVSAMEHLLAGHLGAQLAEIHARATGGKHAA